MSNWQERITHYTAPSIKVEHELRYRAAAPLVFDCETWADLGCGNGVAAAAAIGGRMPRRVLLVDRDPASIRSAAAELELPAAASVCGDLTDESVLARIESMLLEGAGDRVVTCFEVIEHLSTFLPIVEWASRLAREQRVTFLVSVPNDAFWSIENPYHSVMWGERSFDQLQRMLPAERTVLHQVPLSGSAIVVPTPSVEQREVLLATGGSDAVASHFIAAFGPNHAAVLTGALVLQADLVKQRRWERERESNLAIAEATVRSQSATIAEQNQQLHEYVTQFEDWRAYIHTLERRLGDPLSGTSGAETSPGSAAGHHVDAPPPITERDGP